MSPATSQTQTPALRYPVSHGVHLTALFLLQVSCEYGMVHVVSDTGFPRGKDYCILYNPQWAHLPHDLSKAVSLPGHPACGRAGVR